MAAHRIYFPDLLVIMKDVPSAGARDVLVEIEGSEAQHALRVKRLRPGDPVQLFDGLGHTIEASIVDPDAGAAVAGQAAPAAERGPKRERPGGGYGRGPRDRQIRLFVQPVSDLNYTPEPTPRIVIAAAVAKGGRPDDMVDSLSQAGVDAWIPLTTARSVVDPREGKIEKWQRRAIEAAKQCGRDHLLDIRPPSPLDELLERAASDAVRCALLNGDQQGDPVGTAWAACCTREDVAVDEVIAIIGPEGGLSEEEQTSILAISNSRAIHLGPWIMRIETAAVAAGVLLVNAREGAAAASESH